MDRKRLNIHITYHPSSFFIGFGFSLPSVTEKETCTVEDPGGLELSLLFWTFEIYIA